MRHPLVLSGHDQDAITHAAQALRGGGLVAFATETVYGLGADAANANAVAKVYEAKGRPSFNPLIAHLSDTDVAEREGVFDANAATLATTFWPGPLTLVVPRAAGGSVCDLATAGLDTVALRVPDHAGARALLAAFGGPVVAPSANRSGYVSATQAGHVIADIGERLDVVLDSGPTDIGIESTIVACLEGACRLLRTGAIAAADIEAAIGCDLARPKKDDSIQAPGMLASHYAPSVPVRLDATHVAPDEALITFAGARPGGVNDCMAVEDLSPSGSLREAAARLFTVLREMDAKMPRAIAIVPIPDDGLGAAINDRLRRAAVPHTTSRQAETA